MQPKILLCDANIPIRLLTADDEKLTPIVVKLFEDAQKGKHTLYFTTSCIAEIIWVLTSHYKQEKNIIAESLKSLFTQKGILLEEPHITFTALSDFQAKNVDYLDAFHARYALDKKIELISFDTDFKKWPELKWKPPQ